MKTIRSFKDKIPDIKAVRAFYRLLGQLNVPGCYEEQLQPIPKYDAQGNYLGSLLTPVKMYGLNLSDAKDYVESKYTYAPPEAHTYFNQSLEHERCLKNKPIHVIKRIRQFMFMLSKLDIHADSSLTNCKRYFDRMRSRLLR